MGREDIRDRLLGICVYDQRINMVSRNVKNDFFLLFFW